MSMECLEAGVPFSISHKAGSQLAQHWLCRHLGNHQEGQNILKVTTLGLCCADWEGREERILLVTFFSAQCDFFKVICTCFFN